MDEVSSARVVSFGEEMVRVAPALKTCVRMACARGYTVTHVAASCAAGADMVQLANGGANPTDAFKEPRTATWSAPVLLLRAEVGAAPPPFSAVAAAELPPQDLLLVVLLAGCNSEAVRDGEAAALEVCGEDGSRTCAVFVSKQKLTTGARQLLERTIAQRFRQAQHFCLARLQAPVIDHHLVPQHVPLPAKQAAAVRARYPGGPLPRLLHDDPVVKFLALAPGTVVAVQEVLGRSEPTLMFFEVVQRDTAA